MNIEPEGTVLIFTATILASMAAQTPPVSSDQADRSLPVADIIVTARRTEEPLEKTPVPVSAVDGEELSRAGIRQAEGLNQVFPALTVQATASGNLIFIRGVGNFTLLANSDPAIAFNYDGVFITRPNATMSQFFDLARIELLKGPQGVLYGRNASGGSINIEPRLPVFGEISLQVQGSVATSEQLQAEAALNLPIQKDAALRLAGAISTQDHFLSGYASGPRQQSVRAQIGTRISPGVTLRLSADHNHIGGTSFGSSYVGNYVFDAAQSAYEFREALLPSDQGIYAPQAQAYRETIFLAAAGRNLDAIGSRPWQDNSFSGVHARLDADLGFGELTIIPALRRSRIDAVMASSPFGFAQDDTGRQGSLEARLASRRGPVSWLAGMFAMNERLHATAATNLSSLLSFSDELYRTRSRSFFGTVTVQASSSFRVNGGLRWTRDKKSYERDSETASIICQAVVAGRRSCPTVPLFQLVDDFADVPFPVPENPGGRLPILVGGVPTGAIVTRSAVATDGRLLDKALTWRLGVELDLGVRSLLYGSVETGFRPGGFNPATGFEIYDPERIAAFTVGLRHRSADGRFQTALEAFWWNYKDQQISSPRPDLSDPPRTVTITDNVGDSRIRGVEAEIRYRPWSGALIGGTVQYLHSRYGSFRYLQGNSGVPPLAGCEKLLDASSNLYSVDCTEKQPYNSPRWSLALQAQQSFRVGQFELTALMDASYRSARNVGSAFLPQQRVGSTWLSNAQLILSEPGQDWEVGAFIRNLEGDRTPQFMIFHPVSNALITVSGPPRQWGVRASRRF